MAIPMRLNTSGNIVAGPIIKSTDGYSPATGYTSATLTMNFFHCGATATGDFSSWTHTTGQFITTELSAGYYVVALSSNPLSKVGRVRIEITPAGSSGIPFCEEIQVLPANSYDSILSASGTDYLLVDALQMAGETITTDAADNFDNFFYNNNVVSTERISELPTTADLLTTADEMEANVVQMASNAITSDAGDNWENYWFNNDVVSTERVSDTITATPSTVTPLNIGAISSVAVTTQAGANWQLFFNDGGAVTTETVGDLPTTADLLTTSKEMEANVVNIASQALTTQTGANIEGFFAAGATVTKVVNDITTMTSANLSTFTTALPVDIGRIAGATVATGSAQLGVNVVAIASEEISSQSGDNFNTWFYNEGSTIPKHIGNVSTFTTANQVDVGAILGTAITTQAAVNWSTFFDNAGVAVGKDIGDITTMTSASLSTLATANFDNMSTFGTANEVDIGAVKGGAITDINDFVASGYTIGTGSRPLGDLYTALAAFVLPNASWDGTTAVYHDTAGGTTIFSVAIATDDAVVTTV